MADGTFFRACISIAFVVLLLTGISSIKKRLKRYIKKRRVCREQGGCS